MASGISAGLARFARAPFPLPLACDVQHYAWGQKGDNAFIPAFLGVPPTPAIAYAELWIGDNPALPARARLDEGTAVGLRTLMAAAGDVVLAAPSTPARIPFLTKLLAAAQALSIQVHPSRRQAEAGFAEENAQGIPLTDARRNFKDANHKPELLVALTPFWGLKGFRPLEELVLALSVEAPELASLAPNLEVDVVHAGGDAGARQALLRGLYTRAMRMDQAEVNRLVGPLVTRLRARLPAPTPSDRAYWLLRAADDHAGGGDFDRGLMSFFLLNLVQAAPGQAIYLGPGEPHSYLQGVGLEVMANSDNVLRGGLTPKHVDIDRLLDVLVFTDGTARVIEPDAAGVYATPAEEFEVARLALAAGAVVTRGIEHGLDVWVTIAGAAELRWTGAPVPLCPGVPVLVPAKLGPYAVASVDGQDALLFRASERR
jgi:mannose-6-phosphate isomerase class I